MNVNWTGVNREGERRNRKMRLSEQSLEIVYVHVSVFKEASKTLYLFFSLTMQAKMF
jgi:hypothetical protein